MPEPKIFNRNTIIKIILGTILGVLAVWLAFRGVSTKQLGSVLMAANPWLVVLGVIIVLLNVAILAVRWWVMTTRVWQPSDYKALLGGVYLGQMFNILLPARLGELARIYYVSERIETTKSALLGNLVLEKVIDLIAFGVALLLLITAISFPAWVTEPGQTLIILSVICLASIILLLLWGRRFLVWITPLLRKLPRGWGERIASILDRTLTGFDSMRSWRRQLPIWILTFLSLILSTLTNYVVLESVHIQAPFTAALFVLIVLQVGSAPPSAPGKLGVFHYLTVLALSVFSIDKDSALAYSVVLYGVALLPKVIIGTGVIIISKWRLPSFNLDSVDPPKESLRETPGVDD